MSVGDICLLKAGTHSQANFERAAHIATARSICAESRISIVSVLPDANRLTSPSQSMSNAFAKSARASMLTTENVRGLSTGSFFIYASAIIAPNS